MKAEHKLARQGLSVLELAEALGNVSEACRRRGISRTQFYEYKRRFQTHGIEGLRDLRPVHKSHPKRSRAEHRLPKPRSSGVGLQSHKRPSEAGGHRG